MHILTAEYLANNCIVTYIINSIKFSIFVHLKGIYRLLLELVNVSFCFNNY